MSKEEKTKHQGVYQKELSNKDIAYYIRYRIPGVTNPRKEKVGNKSDGMTPDKALKILIDKKDSIKLGNTKDIKKMEGSNFSFEKLYVEYIKKMTEKAQSEINKPPVEKKYKTMENIAKEESIYKNFWGSWVLRKMPLKKITDKHIESHVNEITKIKGYKDKSVYNGVAFAKTVMKHTDDIYNAYNPFEEIAVERPKNNQREEILSEDDCKLLLDELKKEVSIQPYAITLFMLTTGARPTSILNVKITDVDRINKKIRLCDFKRQRMPYYVNLTKELEVVLNDIIGNRHTNSYLFYSNKSEGKKPISGFPNIIDKTIDRLFNMDENGELIRSGKDKIVPYTLRHTFASLLAKREVPIFTIQKLLNHKSVQTTIDNYAKFFPDFASKHVQSFEDLILGG